MSADKRVVLALLGSGEGTDTAQFAIGIELLATARQNLVSIGLMTHIPHDAVLGCVEHVMKGYGKFYNAQTGSQMSWVLGQFLYDILSQFRTKPGQQINIHLPQLAGVINAIEYL
jgi:hypothetical protein